MVWTKVRVRSDQKPSWSGHSDQKSFRLESLIRGHFGLERLIRGQFNLDGVIMAQFGPGPQRGLQLT